MSAIDNLDKRCRDQLLALEWSRNDMDCQGDKCPECRALRNESKRHTSRCALGILCDDIRAAKRMGLVQ